ncbi:peptidase domain-containing ABC transporter [Reichenbachiella agarivorans]|uniref:Peptidase domain-containing ABC transporter n=1 Tax=Reichenbachiella agarivorans TaxID=2979464 RepID=A0ABY6CND8_9BACT|nr:peptidase domain-containing ABC transporter [Reichenbachiella agarivorans]UXP32026.1 peptidase domain-containing ABC transporter [Reichenbachiella agarivorans]
MKKDALVKQRDITDCGAACLASIAAHYDLKLPVSKIRQIAGTDKKGTNALGMVEAAEKLGFSAKGAKGGADALDKIPVPTIAHVVVKEVLHHYVVIYKVTKDTVMVMDPGTGKMETYSKDEFIKIWSGVLILMMPNESFQSANTKVSVGCRFWFLIRPHRSIIIQSIVGAAVFTLIGLTTAIYVQKIVDHVLPSQNQNLLNLLGVAMLCLLAVQIVINSLKSLFVLKTGQQIDVKLILGYYKHLLTLPQRFFDTMRTGEIISRINDAVKIRAFINEIAIDVIINLFVIAFSFVLMFTYYWKLAVVMLLVIPVYLLIYWMTNRFNKKVERKVMEHSAELESQLVESVNSAKTIKMFGMRFHANLKTEIRFVNLLGSVYQSGKNAIFSTNASLTVSRLFTIILLWVGAGFVMDQHISPGELMSFYAIIGYFTGPVSSLIGANRSYQNAMIAADRLFEIMDLETDSNKDKLEILPSEVGDIRFEKVNFRYGTRKTVFENLDLLIPKGKLMLILGESGSGKSTIASLLKRLYKIDSGQILIGNYEINAIHEDSLNALVGIVPQEIDLFAGTVIENIALGEFQPDTQRIVQLAHELGVLDFINELQGGFSAYLGENGTNLSIGQRQRLAILRTLYADPEVVIFDEATSALDKKSEAFVLKTMLRLRDQGKIVISISHRLNAVTMADQIVLLESGRVIANGSHEELLRSNQPYQQLMGQQENINTESYLNQPS